jgi:hypothetical protein
MDGTEITTAGGHLLAFGAADTDRLRGLPERQATRAVAERGGVAFAAHPFSEGSAISARIGRPHPWSDRDDPNLTGLELWSLLTDAAEDWTGPRSAARFLRAPNVNARAPRPRHLREWDAACRRRRVVGIGGLDAHQSGLRARRGRRPLSLMPNERYFRSLATHVLVPADAAGFAAERDAVLDALRSGRCYLAMDWHRPATGFRFWADGPAGALEMGEEARAGDWVLRARTPGPATIRLLRDGLVIASKLKGSAIELATRAPGTYRVEAWLPTTAGELCWIVSNPIYLRRERQEGCEGE